MGIYWIYFQNWCGSVVRYFLLHVWSPGYIPSTETSLAPYSSMKLWNIQPTATNKLYKIFEIHFYKNLRLKSATKKPHFRMNFMGQCFKQQWFYSCLKNKNMKEEGSGRGRRPAKIPENFPVKRCKRVISNPKESSLLFDCILTIISTLCNFTAPNQCSKLHTKFTDLMPAICQLSDDLP